jgi:hypothetical protein
MAHDVFISYAAENKVVADAVCARMEARQIRCWIAPRDVLPGTPYSSALFDAIQGSRVVVLVFSSHANRSDHVMREVELAVSNGTAILPFRIEDIEPSKGLHYFIKSIHWLDALTPPLEKHLEELAEKVQILLSQRAPTGGVISGDAASAPPNQSFRPKWALLMIAAVACVSLILFAVWHFWFSAPTTMLEPAPIQHLVTTLQRHVEDKDRLFTPETPAKLASLLPLRAGEKLELRCEIPKDHHAAFFLLDSNGKLRELAPMQIRTTGALAEMHFPSAGVWQVEEPAGTVLFLAFSNRQSRPLLENVQPLLANGGKEHSRLPAPKEGVLLLMNRAEVLAFGEVPRDIVETPYSRLRDRLESVRANASGRFDYFWGVALPVR